MPWLISNALMKAYENSRSSQAQGAESLVDTCSDGEPSAQSSGNPTQQAYLQPDRMTAFSRLSRFGMTFKPLTADRGEDLLMWYREDFLARTLAPQEKEQGLKEADPVCGSTWHELSVRYDLDSHSWKTHQCLWDEDLPWSSVTLPKWGMTVSGALFRHPTAERPIKGTGYGFWPTPRSCSAMAATITPESAWDQDRFPNLETMVGRKQWPTLQASDNRNRGNLGSGAIQRRQEKGKQIMLSQSVSDISGALNPLWVEWLMGWPLGWTDLKPLATDRFQSWLQQHGEF
jgi:hypothetical protein